MMHHLLGTLCTTKTHNTQNSQENEYVKAFFENIAMTQQVSEYVVVGGRLISSLSRTKLVCAMKSNRFDSCLDIIKMDSAFPRHAECNQCRMVKSNP